MNNIEVRNISKYFPGVVANDNISLTIRRGEIHTILGENGAGKSTLLNILAGMLRPDRGEILIDGRVVSFDSPGQALAQGIGAVYQHFTLVPTLSVLENIMLGLKTGFVLDAGQIERRLESLSGAFGLAVSPYQEVGRLSTGQQQRVEIVKLLVRGAPALLLDEPTSLLTPLEVKSLFEVLTRLKTEGVAVVFITHKLDEALAISDRITILRQGRRVGRLGPETLASQKQTESSRRIVELMFGDRPPAGRSVGPGRLQGEPKIVYVLDQVTAWSDRGAPAVREISLRLAAGEILGVAGVEGNGQKELGEVMAGQRTVSRGRLILEGIDMTNRGAAAFQKAGVGYVSDDRLGEATVPSLTVAENLVLKAIEQRPFSQNGILDRAAIDEHARRLIREFDIKTSGPAARLGTLSGGNIQKLLLGRELAAQTRVLICNKPTQGLDVATAQFIWGTLRARAGRGLAILLISADLDEIMAVSDRIGVMYNGRLAALFDRAEADLETIGRSMVGQGVQA